MKCIKCHAEIEQDAQFCPYCGTKVEHIRCCVKCGKPLDDDSDFCPYCGTRQNDVVVEPEQVEEVHSQEPELVQKELAPTPVVVEQPQEPEIVQEEPEPIPVVVEQPQEPEEKKVESEPPSSSVQEETVDTIQPFVSKPTSKKWLWIIGAIILLGILGGCGYYFMKNKGNGLFYVKTDSNAEVGDSIIVAGEDVKVIETRLHNLFSALITENGDKYLPEYFTEGFNTYYKRACEKADKESCERPRIWWQESESDPTQFVKNSVIPISENEAKSDVTLKSEMSGCNFEVIVRKENGNWLIDKITQKDCNDLSLEDTSKENSDIVIAYTNILNNRKESMYDRFYFLHDVTGDGVPELWIQESEDGVTSTLLIYEFKDGAASKIYQNSVGHPAHHSFEKINGYICLSFGHMGSMYVEQYEYKNGKIQTKEIYSREANDDEDDPNEPKGVEIETHEITDKKPLGSI